MNYHIIPSIIARSQAELETRLKKILALKPKQVHLDIMDGLFVKRTSLEFDISLPKSTAYEAHLMMRDPHGWFVKNRVSISSAIIHYESKAHIHDFIKLAKKYKKSFGIALNPETPSEDIAQYLGLIDNILVMTVHPGKYGSPFLPSVLNKIKRIRELNKKIDIEVDGGITPETLRLCRCAGANQFVAGSFLQNAKNVKKAWTELTRALN
ncbi:MAG TPA: ribulose-phosphate 3-epimerase [Candidatus Nanoarchaeia archaeon]|nr:ribulose-phosphate 3-epimerase [Candidatus Nanoarchaeia archaeon]